ncbi:MCE family protein [Streptomyces endophyticus]|uniref:MCE family protein n=1 Tax=Streptomyces endophyticus TaxID=714166 RepID=A0ABU6FB31_9ACTN|nr:MCE family protein [Streptomyces endophyticus]MEB8341189.1 MCE family protein [Streptomyces endophyticus]
MSGVRGAKAIQLRLYGVVFIVVLGLLVTLSVAVYEQKFTPVVRITLEADSTGNQLDERADVKLRGVLVGEVRSVRADGAKATLDLALKPGHVASIPADVHARLLPKTLFGEKFVDLIAPAHTAGRAIRAGDVITQDRTRVGTEVQQLLDDLLPLLRAVQPAKLNATLSAFAGALEGRGDRIGDNLTRVADYLGELNPHLPDLTEDIARLAEVADVYGDAAPDLLDTLRNTVTTSRTLVEKRDRLASALASTTGVAGTADDVLRKNGERLITVNRVARPTLALLSRYSPVYPCFFEGMVRQDQLSQEVFKGGRMHITLEVVQPQQPYRPGEEPRYGARSGPDCHGLPHPEVPSPGVRHDDGSKHGSPGLPLSPDGPADASATRAEQHTVGALVAPVLDVPADDVPPVATLLFGPLARGTGVSVA